MSLLQFFQDNHLQLQQLQLTLTRFKDIVSTIYQLIDHINQTYLHQELENMEFTMAIVIDLIDELINKK